MLTKNQINEIEAKAMDVLLTAYSDESQFTLPIDVQKVAKALQLTLKEGIFKDDQVVGAYDRANKTIFVAERDPYTRKAFTIAHEMGHFILHADKAQEVFFRRDLISIDKEDRVIEQQANCFAANLLMPRGILIRYLGLTHDIARLADIFGVSFSAMSLRLKTLGIGDE